MKRTDLQLIREIADRAAKLFVDLEIVSERNARFVRRHAIFAIDDFRDRFQ